MLRNIIFDWSGTLVDDLPAVWKATNHVLEQAGRPEISIDKFRAEFCLPFTIFYDRHVPDVTLDQLEVWFHSKFQQVQDSVCPLPHSRAFLEFCKEKGIRTFLLSTVHAKHFAVQAESSGLGDFIQVPYVGIRDKREKIHEILQTHHLSPGETLFIGDMQHDIETARHGGIHSCAVLTGYNTLEQLRSAKPDLIVEHLGELRQILERNQMHFHSIQPLAEAHQPVPTVGALIFNDAHEVLMIQTRKWSELWGIPGGKIKWGETSEDALRREIAEETNLHITDINFVLVQDCIHSREFYRDAHFILINYTARCHGPARVVLNEEAHDFKWVPLREALGMSLNKPTRVLLEAVHQGA